MRKIRLFDSVLFCCFLVALLGLTTCTQPDDSPEPVSQSERLQMWIDDLNARNYGNVYKNCHPDAAMFNTGAKDPAFWDGDFDDTDHSLSVTFGGDQANGTISSLTIYSNGMPIRVNFKEDDPDVWKILTIDIDKDGGGYGGGFDFVFN